MGALSWAKHRLSDLFPSTKTSKCWHITWEWSSRACTLRKGFLCYPGLALLVPFKERLKRSLWVLIRTDNGLKERKDQYVDLEVSWQD